MKNLLLVLILAITLSCTSQTKVVATVYNAVPAQTNSDPGHTASMFELDLSNPYKHKIIAVSRDLLVEYPMHTKVLIKGTNKYDGVYIVEDKMNKRYENRIDILINQDMQIGKWNNVTMTSIK
jgi:3D (Asp-Asp-Asp) domain-containing protein